jgi:5-methylcytosine-specific restriction endonuclease McrA|tara:strand:- start:297 stop:533 length:237 start_codon:yes stop_codon:yes gene_type:complete
MIKKKKRNYREEYDSYHKLPKQRKNNNARHRARYAMKLKPGDKREVDHKKPLSKGGSNKRSNLRLVSRRTNRRKGAKA